MKTFLSLLLIVSTGFSTVLTCAQTPAQDQDDVIRVRSNEVRLDIVVKDKKGRPIKDLKQSDFEVLEDGVAQKVESFRFVSRESGPVKTETKDDKIPGAPPGTGTTTTPPRSTPTVTALVFDRLSPEARSLARKAGLSYAHEGMESGGFTGVFGIDQNLRTIQNFTDNTQLVQEAVEQATSTSTSTYASGAEKMRSNAERINNLNNQISGSAAAAV